MIKKINKAGEKSDWNVVGISTKMDMGFVRNNNAYNNGNSSSRAVIDFCWFHLSALLKPTHLHSSQCMTVAALSSFHFWFNMLYSFMWSNVSFFFLRQRRHLLFFWVYLIFTFLCIYPDAVVLNIDVKYCFSFQVSFTYQCILLLFPSAQPPLPELTIKFSLNNFFV